MAHGPAENAVAIKVNPKAVLEMMMVPDGNHKKQCPGIRMGQIQILLDTRDQGCRYDPGNKVNKKNGCQNQKRTDLLEKGSGMIIFSFPGIVRL